jgi:hypothetical protein
MFIGLPDSWGEIESALKFNYGIKSPALFYTADIGNT